VAWFGFLTIMELLFPVTRAFLRFLAEYAQTGGYAGFVLDFQAAGPNPPALVGGGLVISGG